MSVKVYNGIKVEDIGMFMDELSLLKEYLSKKDNTKYESMHHYVENKVSDGENINDVCLEYVRLFRLDAEDEIMYVKMNDLKIRYYSNGLAIPISNDTDLIKKVQDFKSVKKYEWWDNVDKKEGVSDEEWERIGEEWKNTFKREGNGMEITVFKEDVNIIRYLTKYSMELDKLKNK